MRRKLVIGNWKMHTTFADASVLTTSLRGQLADLSGVTVVLCPPYPWLVPLAEMLNHRPPQLKLGAQDIYYVDEGSVTGAVSAAMLKGIIEYAIIGHSERRRIFKETLPMINDKVHALLRHGMHPVIAIGEWKKLHHQQRKHHGRPTKLEAQSDIGAQLRATLDGVSPREAEKLVVVYEPVWAISAGLGTGEAADGAYVNHVAGLIRTHLRRRFGAAGAEIPILYGGSVTAENVKEFVPQPEVDGVLVGAASLVAKQFSAICYAFAR